MRSLADQRRLIELVDSPSNGITLDTGVTTEMGEDAAEAIRYFGSRDRINHVHFRNVRVETPYYKYLEVMHDEGDCDMLACMQAFDEVGLPLSAHPRPHSRVLGRYAWIPDGLGVRTGLSTVAAPRGGSVSQNHPLIAILGPTASGKSDLSLFLAERVGGEIVNYDSVQLYRGFDIGSAKTPSSGRRGIPHHLIDILEPNERASAGDYARRARQTLADIAERGKTPILVGGTGFYLRAALEGLFEGSGRDDGVRARLERSSAKHGKTHLHRLLARLDPDAAAAIHPHDAPKVIRALEVRLLEGKPISMLHRQRESRPLKGFRILKLGLAPSREALYERIEKRTQAMYEGGLLEEVRRLLATGVSSEAWPFGAVGYRQALACVQGELTLEEAIADTAQATRNYAKRQLTWFRNQENSAHWLEGFGDEPPIQTAALRFVASAPA